MTAKPIPTEEPAGAATKAEFQLMGHIRERLHIEIPGPDAELLESGLIDSLAFVELLLILSDEFGVEPDIADLDMDNFRSVRRIGEFISVRQAPGPTGAR
jgi:acyl carrier protein